MEKLKFTITINAPKEKVWTTLWEDATYRKWTSAFSEGSYAVSDWKEGSKILFLSPEGDGMYSNISKMIPNEQMTFKHIGVVKEGKEQPLDEETKKWSGGTESYTLTEKGSSTELLVELDTVPEHKEYFQNTFPKALELAKKTCGSLGIIKIRLHGAMTAKRAKAKSIDEYISWFPEETQARMEKIRELIKKLAPKAEETISYAIPAFRLNGTYLIYFAGFEKHIGVYPIPVKDPEFKKAFADYKTGRGSIQFPLNESLPIGLLSKIIKFRIKETKERLKAKKK